MYTGIIILRDLSVVVAGLRDVFPVKRPDCLVLSRQGLKMSSCSLPRSVASCIEMRTCR